LPSEAPTSGPAPPSILASILAVFVLAWAGASGGGPPPEDNRPTLAAPPSAGVEDAMAAPLHEGSAIGYSDLLALKDLFPPEVWKYRDIFFHEGMRMEIGGCHRRYPLSAWYTEASQRYAGRARVDDDGNLRDYTAGVPFAPDSIDPKRADAGVRWAWNFEQRYTGAGPVGSFRLLDLPSRVGTPETYKGTFFLLRTAHRADLASSEYRVPEAKDRDWVGGGEFEEPFNARFLAWRQLRPTKTERRYQEPDDTFVYVPTMRKVRRAAASWVDGFYTPRYAASGVDGGGGGVPFGAGEFGPTGAINPTAGNSIATTDHVRRGFVGLSLRPNAYDWTYVGERAVLAPLNGVRPGYPESPDRNYGPSGLSVGSDRWDVRWAVVIQGRARRVIEDVGFVTLYIDYQTQQPLYLITHRPNRLLLEVGILVHRYSGDLPRYATFPDGGQANVFDPVAAVFYEVREGGSGWRRESYDVRSVPVDPNRLRQMTSTDDLLRGR
jgi:Protein of unknown function (DUF1329)